LTDAEHGMERFTHLDTIVQITCFPFIVTMIYGLGTI
jgi:hypothetical protein